LGFFSFAKKNMHACSDNPSFWKEGWEM